MLSHTVMILLHSIAIDPNRNTSRKLCPCLSGIIMQHALTKVFKEIFDDSGNNDDDDDDGSEFRGRYQELSALAAIALSW